MAILLFGEVLDLDSRFPLTRPTYKRNITKRTNTLDIKSEVSFRGERQQGETIASDRSRRTLRLISRPSLTSLLTFAKAFSTDGSLRRCMANFTNSDSPRLLSRVLVRSCLEYATVIWSPHRAKQSRYRRNLLGFPAPVATFYHSVANKLNFRSLETRRISLDLWFLFEIVVSVSIRCPQHLDLINLYTAIKPLKLSQLFLVQRYTRKLSVSDSVNRICDAANSFSDDLDSSANSTCSFKVQIYKVL